MGSQSRSMNNSGKKLSGWAKPRRVVHVNLNHNPEREQQTRPYADYLRQRYSAVRKPRDKEDKR
jgi:hypothetical protein